MFAVDEVEGVDGAGRNGTKQANAVEEVTDDVFLGDPAVLTVIVARGIEGGFLKQGFP